ncbi:MULTISPECIES: aminotransferase class V-fold PLP-dependent enzyme [unclassified Bradyrhizobium]|uniref:aminotransferase class V-fold PLP-dependent enzyme n=1 Tax=unclassified Bradyrhizobium TaxID=2631580 RepID=UPI0023B1F334|nr:aminotransferase class V-fold PLP-dependent enzyme [Bradyrhizobium sp. CSS354]
MVDTAHSWGQLDFTVSELGADFVGFNLHKWIGAPIGVGFLYIRKERLSRTVTATWATRTSRRPTSARGCTLARSFSPPCDGARGDRAPLGDRRGHEAGPPAALSARLLGAPSARV